MLLCDARCQYLRWLIATRHLSAHTVRAYKADLSAFESHAGAMLEAAAIDRDLAVAFLGSLRDRGLAPTTIKRRASGVRGMCRWLIETSILAEDPWAGLIVSSGTRRLLPRNVSDGSLHTLLNGLCAQAGVVPQRVPRVLRSEGHEATTLLAVAIMVGTGVRVGEVVAIRCGDVDVAAGTLRITGKGSRERCVYLTNDWIAGLVESYVDLRSGKAIDHDRLLFNRRLAPLTPADVRTRLHQLLTGLGITERVTPHMLRHTAATKLIEHGIDIRLIQTLLGHASVSTTEIYTHVSNPTLQRAITEVDVLGRSLALR